MVQIVLKKSEQDQFLIETTCDESNDALIRRLVQLGNMRIKVQLLASSLLELAEYGPAKPPAEHGLDDAERSHSAGPTTKQTPMDTALGEAPSEQLQMVLKKVAEDAAQSIMPSQVNRKVPLTRELLQEKIDLMRGGVTMAYPMGLPKWDPIYEALADTEHKADMYGPDCLDPETAQLWWAGKEFLRDQTVGQRLGNNNEKTKITAKLQNPGSGPPAREPAISEDERKAMMAHYFKKQEELKQMANNDEDDYLNANWANPKALKSQLQGTTNIGWR